jgi:broad specificity phosphatase PhoE
MPTIKLVRHGQSIGNAQGYDNAAQADSLLHLTEKGVAQAIGAGTKMGPQFVHPSIVYTSPYIRARETMSWIFKGAQCWPEKGIYEDPRLREVDHGYHEIEDQEALKDIHGAFYYRFKGGESPADCYDRISTFLESMMRQIKRKEVENVLIVSHGITIRCFVMRFLHLRVEDFNRIRNPWNADIITIAAKENIKEPQFTSGRWGIEGLKFK